MIDKYEMKRFKNAIKKNDERYVIIFRCCTVEKNLINLVINLVTHKLNEFQLIILPT